MYDFLGLFLWGFRLISSLTHTPEWIIRSDYSKYLVRKRLLYFYIKSSTFTKPLGCRLTQFSTLGTCHRSHICWRSHRRRSRRSLGWREYLFNLLMAFGSLRYMAFHSKQGSLVKSTSLWRFEMWIRQGRKHSRTGPDFVRSFRLKISFTYTILSGSKLSVCGPF